jgi:heterodisulfide reductase subunit A
VLLAGTAHSPQPLREVVAQAEASAQRAYALLAAPEMVVSHGASWVHHAICARCGLCVASCPHGARELDQETGQIVVHALACRACGLCAAACPSGAARIAAMGEAQIMAAVDAALEDLSVPTRAERGGSP